MAGSKFNSDFKMNIGARFKEMGYKEMSLNGRVTTAISRDKAEQVIAKLKADATERLRKTRGKQLEDN